MKLSQVLAQVAETSSEPARTKPGNYQGFLSSSIGPEFAFSDTPLDQTTTVPNWKRFSKRAIGAVNCRPSRQLRARDEPRH